MDLLFGCTSPTVAQYFCNNQIRGSDEAAAADGVVFHISAQCSILKMS